MTDRPDITVVAEGKHTRYVRRGDWEFLKRVNITGIVGMIPITDDGKLVLVRQYRPPVDAEVIEIPAGLVGDEGEHRDESLADAARRELIEETGYQAREMVEVCRGVPASGGLSATMNLFLATGLRKVGPGGGDHTEDIAIHEVPLAEVRAWLAAREAEGAWIDLKVYAGLYFAQQARL